MRGHGGHGGGVGGPTAHAITLRLAHTCTYDAPLAPEPTLVLSSTLASGYGRQTTEGFVVLAGAKLRSEVAQSAPESVHKNRKRFADLISSDGILERDTLFTSPSAASDFLTGASTSGKLYWKNEQGLTLRELEQAEIEAATASSV